MAQTNKQTNKLSTWWLTTTFNEDEIARIQDPRTWLPDILKIHGGMELCPETQRLHYQGAIQLRPGKQQRMSYFKTWLPTTHFEPAKNAIAVQKYAMKSETAAGEKKIISNPSKYYSAHEMCLKVGSQVTDDDMLETADHKVWYKRAVTKLLREDITITAQVMNPTLKNFWCDFALVFISKSRELERIQPPEEGLDERSDQEEES